VDSCSKRTAKEDFIKKLSTGGSFLLRVKTGFKEKNRKKLPKPVFFEIIIGFPDLQGLVIWNHHETHLPTF
jgi:hypothetical protein